MPDPRLQSIEDQIRRSLKDASLKADDFFTRLGKALCGEPTNSSYNEEQPYKCSKNHTTPEDEN